jgi:hypothetical protein
MIMYGFEEKEGFGRERVCHGGGQVGGEFGLGEKSVLPFEPNHAWPMATMP